MKYVLFGLLASLPFSAFAFEKTGNFVRYSMDETSSHSIRVVFKKTFTTLDGCNHFGLSGSMRPVKVPDGTRTVVQDFLANFAVISTKMACPPLRQPRTIKLESNSFEIQPISGEIYANILVPEGMTVEIAN